MLEFLQECVKGPNLFATIFLGLMAFYWLMVILGVLGLEAFDLDVDADVGLDGVDADLDTSFDFGDILRFFHLGDVPVMIFASFFALFLWIITLVSNHYLNSGFSMLVMLYLFLPCVLISLFATKLVIMPLVPIFATGNDPNKGRDKLIGERALVTTGELTEKFGQIQIRQDGPPMVLNARTENGQTLKKGDVVEIVSHIKESDLFIVKLAKWEND